MSVTTSSANVEPPPLLFGQRSPSPTSFSSPPQSPNHLHHPQTPVASPPPPAISQDVDMSTSTTLPPLQGQNHDRQEDSLMRDPGRQANGHMEAPAVTTNIHDSVAVEVAAVDEDVMDTTPDNSQGQVLPNGSADPQDAPATSPVSPEPNGIAQGEAAINSEPVPPPTEETTQQEHMPPPEFPPPTDPSSQAPPPPDPVRSDSDSSDDDDGQQPWHPIKEDMSSPDEEELKAIENGVEVSALNHEHWEQKAFQTLDEPEYTPGPSGRIEWAIDNYNGTREKPNRELVMKSDVVTVGGYEWQIKFYPKGNDSEYLSVYVECLSVHEKGSRKEEAHGAGEEPKEGDTMVTGEDEEAKVGQSSEARESQHAPLPLLHSKSVPKRKSVAAQVSVVLYNPTEPRVNHSRTCLHRFCTGSPDWGWTRFHGPYYEIAHRTRGQRQALLRDDKLAFTAYIRVIEDETSCLWEHSSRENPWDSFAMTGLQSLAVGEGNNIPPGGNIISALASWLLFKPFRRLLYEFKAPNPESDPFVRPKLLIGALQKILYTLRTQVDPGAPPVALDDILDALDFYGIHDSLEKLDVIEIWEVLRTKIESELEDTSYANALDDLFGVKKDYALGVPSYRAPVMDVRTMQEAVNKAVNLTHPGQPLPQLLTVELDRQDFDVASRSYVKLLNKVTLDEHITIRQTPYTLFGFVVHKQTLQSYVYHPVLRPEGPGSKWYNYTDGKEENLVKCLAKRQAIDAHEGKNGSGKVIGNDPVAYIVMYVRDDVAASAFTSSAEDEQWEVPNWIEVEVEKEQAIPVQPPPPPTENPTSESGKEPKPVKEPEPPNTREFQVIDSRAFQDHEGPGAIDVYDPRWQLGNSEHVYAVQLTSTDSCKDIRDKLATIVKDIENPRQIKFWFLDALRGSFARPHLLGTGIVEYSCAYTDRYIGKEWTLQHSPYSWATSRIWIHVLDVKDLTELPKEKRKIQEPEPEPAPASGAVPPTTEVSSGENISDPENQSPPPPPPPEPEQQREPHTEDTPMSEPDDSEPPPQIQPFEVQSPEPQAQEVQPPVTRGQDVTDTTMTEMEVEVAVEAAIASDPTAIDVIVSNLLDTEMGGMQDNAQSAPPPPVEAPVEPVPAPEATSIQPPDERDESQPEEIYFFLKFFDAESQTLSSRGSHIAKKADRVGPTIFSLLHLPPDKDLELVEEEDLTTTRPIKNRRSFAQNDLPNPAILIASFPTTEAQRSALAAHASFADIYSFLVFRSVARNFPLKLAGHVTLDHFSAQFYKGEIKNGYRHGQGTRVYHSGATYEGSFRLGQRHGHGLYTFQNGDTYEGEWVANQQHGSGTFVEAATGNTYVGGWRNDKRYGEGVTHWKNAQETERMCRICWESEADSAFYDCGHVVACLGCARQVQNCPVCRKRVVSAMKLYYVA